ncbi:MAG: endo-1,4-beta-xylanase [Verrucomicrobiia bacterium]
MRVTTRQASPVLILVMGILTTVLATHAYAQPALKDAYKDYFLVGAALNEAQVSGTDSCEVALIKKQFNTISPENLLKWGLVHPEPNKYDFGPSDRYVEFGRENRMFIVGHNLVWHYETPTWVFQDDKGNPVDRDTLLARMREHILTVVGRYKGKIGGWDVVNEALDEDGTLRKSPWLRIIGEDYLLKAYQFAHEADPQAQLYYNDYLLENPGKREGAIALIKKLQSQGIHIAAIGLQGHYNLNWPTTEDVGKTIQAFSSLGLKVMITELDIDVLPPASHSQAAEIGMNFELQAKLNPYTNGLPDSVQQTLAKRYADLFAVFLKHRDSITRVTFWGVTDANSCLNYWPVKGRTSYPLLFDRHCQPKPAFDAVVQAARHP